ncbi:hypothetical protein [Bacillus sp. AFS001701]|nr:hypothetical protein [Bacillus sp. AFS001701]
MTVLGAIVAISIIGSALGSGNEETTKAKKVFRMSYGKYAFF